MTVCTPRYNQDTRDLMRLRDELRRVAEGAKTGDFTAAMRAKANDLIDEGLSPQEVLDQTHAWINKFSPHEKAEVLDAILHTRRAAPTKTEAQVRRNQIKAELRDLEALDPKARAAEEDRKVKALEKQLSDLLADKSREGPGANRPDSQRVAEARAALEAARKARDEANKKPPADPTETYNKTRATVLKKQLAELERRIRENDFAPAVKPTPKELSEANTRAQMAVVKAKAEFAQRQFEDEMSKRSPMRKIFGTVVEGANLARSVMTSLDLSAVLRQGGFIALGHPSRAANSLVPSLKAFVSEKAQFAVDREIAERPNAPMYKKYGLELTDSHTYVRNNTAAHYAKMEEAFMSRWVDKLPTAVGGGLLRGSNRAYSTFLNKLRADSYDAMAAALGRSEKLTDAEGKAIADYINVATGRGRIGISGKVAVGLNTVFFAPRLVASRFNILAGQPLYAGSARTRRLIALEYGRFLTGVGMVYALGALANGGNNPIVSVDPRSTDFGKMRFGDTYIDPLTGLAQVTSFLAKVITGEKRDGKGRVVPLRDEHRLTDVFPGANPNGRDGKLQFNDETEDDVAVRFLRTKLAPVPGAIWNNIKGEDVVGNKVSAGSTVKSLVTPMSMNNIYEVMTDNGVPAGTAIEMLNLLGMGVSYRDPDQKKGGKK